MYYYIICFLSLTLAQNMRINISDVFAAFMLTADFEDKKSEGSVGGEFVGLYIFYIHT